MLLHVGNIGASRTSDARALTDIRVTPSTGRMGPLEGPLIGVDTLTTEEVIGGDQAVRVAFRVRTFLSHTRVQHPGSALASLTFPVRGSQGAIVIAYKSDSTNLNIANGWLAESAAAG